MCALATNLVNVHAISPVLSTHKLGAFTITLSLDGSISAAGSVDHRVFWATNPSPWLKSGAGKWSFDDTEGMAAVTLPNDWDKCKTSKQTISDAVGAPGRVSFSGSLVGSGTPFGCKLPNDVNYTIDFTIAPESRNQMRIEVTTSNELLDTSATTQDFVLTEVSMTSEQDERIYGLGVQYSAFNLKGRVVPVITSEQGVGRGLEPLSKIIGKSAGNWHTTYSAIPHYITSTSKDLTLENSDYSIFNFLDNSTAVQVFSSSAILRVVYAGTPLELVSEYTLYSGRQKRLPEWIMEGPVIGYEGGTKAVVDLNEKLVAAGIKPSAYWLQDWTGLRQDVFGTRLWWNWELDEDHYPNFEELATNLSKQGTSLMTYINPFLANTVTKDKPNFQRDLFKEAEAAGYLVEKPGGGPYILASGSPSFTFGMVDFSNPKAKSWYTDIISTNMLGTHQRGWMADFAEYLPFDGKIYNGSAAVSHNLYPQQWAESNFEAVSTAKSPAHTDAVYFMRSSHTKSPSFSTLFWLGDQLVTWDDYDGLATTVIGHLSSGVSGLTLQHSDIGGYTMVKEGPISYLRNKELLVRWTEMSAISDAILRTHPGNLPNESWQVYSDDATMKCFSRLVGLHNILLPYRSALMNEATFQGHPIVRPLWFHFPEDSYALDVTNQFMLGQDILAAPVLNPGKTSTTVYLPIGGWINLWSGQPAGRVEVASNITVPAPMGFPPMFARINSDVSKTLPPQLRNLPDDC